MSYYNFCKALSAVEIETVRRKYIFGEDAPASINTADLPCQWVQPPGVSEEADHTVPFYSGQEQGFRTHRATLIVLITPVAQGTPAKNLEATIKMVDYITAAINAADLGMGLPTVSCVATPTIDVGDPPTAYWGVIATVEVMGSEA